MTAALARSSANAGLRSDIALASLVVAVIVMMALPLPPWALDILVALNISIGIVLLLVALFVGSPLAFSTFPSVLLITTLFRISLSVATTRQILLHAHAGEIINAFGRLVVGGSLVVGLVVFLIITVVQFIVIAKGAERVAEVGARFTLDALPGKQMSIDADLRAGLLTQADALAKRRELVLESQFYGAMDGAMKFVKGDAVAGIVIVLVNLIGGIAIGTLSLDLGIGAAVQRYSVLSIGDGLVTQIPALFVSIAAGIAITRTAPDNSANLGAQIGRQLAAQPRALLLGAGVMALFAAVPGFPTFTFLALAGLVAAISTSLRRRQSEELQRRRGREVLAAARDGETAPVLLADDLPAGRPPSPFRLEISAALADRITAPVLDAALARERQRLRQEYGLPFPGIALLRDAARSDQSFSILVQELPELTLVVPEGRLLLVGGVSVDGAAPPLPLALAPGRWVDATEAPALQEAGEEVLSAAQVIARATVRTLQRHASAVLGVQEVRLLLRDIEWRYGDLIRESQQLLPLAKLSELMAALARESVPLADLPGLLQAIVTSGPSAADTHSLYEAVRVALARNIVARLLPPGVDSLRVVHLDKDFEARLRSALVVRPDGPVLALSPEASEPARQCIAAGLAAAQLRHPVIALPADLRRATSRLFRASFPHSAFLSHEELGTAGIAVQGVARVTMGTQW